MTKASIRDGLVIRVPCHPPASLRPNAKVDPRRKAPDVAAYREIARLAGLRARADVSLAAVLNGGAIFRGPVAVEVTVGWGKDHGRQRRMPDVDALGLMCKPGLDGALQDAGIVADDRQVGRICYGQTRDPDGAGYTLIVVRALDRRPANEETEP